MGVKVMKEKTRDSYFLINFIASIIASVLSYGISFFLTPYMVNTVGSEAYGFVSLANNMVNYAAILTIALNSVAGRFITIKIHEGKEKEANADFNSVFWADIIIALVLFSSFVPIVYKLEYLINIPENLVESVKLLFIFVFINFLITVIGNVFSVATFVKNILYLSSLGNCICAMLRVALLVFLFGVFPVNIAYIGITATVCSITLTLYNVIVTRKLLPMIRIDLHVVSFAKIKEMFAAGIWSSVTKLSQILSDGLDLLICNLWIGPYAMGQLSISYTIPTIFSGVLCVFNSLFCPQQTYYYAKEEIENVINELKFNMKFSGFFVSILFAGVIVYGYDFFALWVPGENISMIYVLSCISIVSVLASGIMSSLGNVFLLTNNLKVNSLVWMGVGCFNAIAVVILVQFTDLGVFAIAGVSKVVSICVSITYIPIYAAICLKIPRRTFYPLIIGYVLDTMLLVIVFFFLKKLLLPADTVLRFILDCIVVGVFGSILNYIFLLNKKEKIRMKSLYKK